MDLQDEMFIGTFEAPKIETPKTEAPKTESTTTAAPAKEAPQKNEYRSGLIFLIVVVSIAVLAIIYGIITINKIDFNSIQQAPIAKPNANGIEINASPFYFEKRSFSRGKYIANLHIKGVIQKENQNYNQAWLLNTIQDLQYDTNNLGILLVIDSPGGTVYEADEVYLALQEYKESGKALWAYFESLAASGGYYIGCAADTIYANRNTLTGSIGVIAGTSIDATEFLTKHGIRSTTFTAGKNKNMLNYNSPLTEEQRKIMQSIADDAYDQFTSIVASARQKSIDEVKTLADGRIYTARQATENGLIDSIGTLEEAQDKLRDSIALSQGLSYNEKELLDFCDYQYEYQQPFFNKFFGMFTDQKSPDAMVDPVTKAALETLAPNITYPAYLYRQ